MAIREFSDFERKVITEKLIQGSGLSHLFQDDFRANVKIMVSVRPDREHTLEFYSDRYSADQIFDTLVDLIDLLSYLEQNGLVRKHFPPATSMRDYTLGEVLSLCDSDSTQSVKFILPDNLEQLVDFIKDNENVVFRATEPLRSLASHNFRSLEERMHDGIIQQARNSNRTAIGIALASIFVNIVAIVVSYNLTKNSYDDVNRNFGSLQEEFKSLRSQHSQDSMLNTQIRKSVSDLKRELDSMKHKMRFKNRNKQSN